MLHIFLLVSNYALPFQESKTEWRLSRDQRLYTVVTTPYGHLAYQGLVGHYNGIDAYGVVPKGTVIKTPPLPEMFVELGLFPTYEEEFTKIFKALESFRELMPSYRELREKVTKPSRGGNEEPTMLVPDEMRRQFEQQAQWIMEAVAGLEEKTAGSNTPRKTINQFKEAVLYIQSLGAGYVDGYGYDLDLVEQRIAYGLGNAVAWSKE